MRGVSSTVSSSTLPLSEVVASAWEGGMASSDGTISSSDEDEYGRGGSDKEAEAGGEALIPRGGGDAARPAELEGSDQPLDSVPLVFSQSDNDGSEEEGEVGVKGGGESTPGEEGSSGELRNLLDDAFVQPKPTDGAQPTTAVSASAATSVTSPLISPSTLTSPSSSSSLSSPSSPRRRSVPPRLQSLYDRPTVLLGLQGVPVTLSTLPALQTWFQLSVHSIGGGKGMGVGAQRSLSNLLMQISLLSFRIPTYIRLLNHLSLSHELQWEPHTS